MRRSLLLSLGLTSILSLALSAALMACSSDSKAPPPQSIGAGPGPAGTGDPAPVPTTTATTTPPPPPPEPEWVAPTVATTSSACGTPRDQAIHADFTTPAGRTFHVWGPTGYDPNKTYPVVIAFHGWYADGAAHEAWFEMEKYVDNAAFVVYPDAVAGLWDLNGDTDLVFFDDMVKQLGQTYCINPSRVFGFGFSYGGKFMNHLGCRRAGYVKAISIGDGSDGGDSLKCGRLPVLVTSRTHDTNELVAWGRATAANWSMLDNCSTDSDVSAGPDATQCVTQRGCKTPGAVTFCEDTWFDPTWPVDWNHTVRESYRAYTWHWFDALP